MNKKSKKLMVALLALSCAACCTSAGVMVKDFVAPTNTLNASAETVYEVNSLTFTGGSATEINAYPNDGSGKPDVGSWDHVYSIQSGNGVMLNGVAIANYQIKFPHDFYISIGVEIKEGDVLTFDGSFHNAEKDTTFVFNNCSLQWNGTAWVEYVETTQYKVYEAGAVKLTGDSSATAVYAYKADESKFEVTDDTWAETLTFEAGSGVGVTLNGTQIDMGEIKIPGDIYINLRTTAVAGDVLAIGGTFYNETLGVKYVIDESRFEFNGTAWVEYVEKDDPEVPTDYTEYEIGKVNITGGDASTVYFKSANGAEMPVDSWEYRFSFEADSGVGLTLNDTALETEDIKAPGNSVYVGLGVTAVNGDVLTIGGTFYNETLGVKYVIDESSFIFDGTEWKPYGVEITTHELGALVLHVNSKPFGDAGTVNHQLYLARADEEALPVLSWDYVFSVGADGYFKVNGEVKNALEIKSTDAGFFFLFPEMEAGDVITIGGTFVCDMLGVKYVIEESSFAWTGANWKIYIEYTDYDLGTMYVLPDSTAQRVYLRSNNDIELPIDSWDEAFAFSYGYGNGITLNGTMISMTNSVKSVEGNLFIDLGVNAIAGDVLVISGAITCDAERVQYVFGEMTFVFDGTAWLDQLGIAQRDAKAALDAYMDNFTESDYYASEWESFADIIARGKARIDSAVSEEEINAIVEATKAEMDDVVTKEESDASFDTLRANAITTVATYKNESDYKPEQWAVIQAIIENATAEINASTSVTAMNNAVATAKAEMDAVKTAAQIAAEEAAVATAKSEVQNYKSESDYKAEQWTAIQAIVASATAAIDNAIGNQTEIDSIVATAKAEMDAVKTSAQIDAEEAAVASAKAELDGYKSESDYKAEQWTAIQEIIAATKAVIDNAIGNQEAIDSLVASAKAEIDMLPTAAEVDAAALAAAKATAKEEVRAYYNTINLDLYSDEALSEIGAYVSAANAAIDAAATEAEISAAVAQLKANVESVVKVQPGNSGDNSSSTSKSSGCGSTTSALAAGMALATAAGVVAIRKKKENE